MHFVGTIAFGVVPINNPQNPPLFKLSCKLDLLIKLLQLSHPCSSSISFISMASACSKTTSLPPKRGQIKAQIFRIFVNAIVFVALKVVEAARSITNSQSNEVEAKVEENSASTPLLLLWWNYVVFRFRTKCLSLCILIIDSLSVGNCYITTNLLLNKQIMYYKLMWQWFHSVHR